MSKIFVLDTNVLLSDPMSPLSFEDNVVVIPTIVLEELDSKKHLMDEIGRNARLVSRQLDDLRKLGKLHEGVSLPSGGKVQIVGHPSDTSIMSELFTEVTNDNKIISIALYLQAEYPSSQVILVSKDSLVRIKADAVGVQAEDYLNDKVITSNDRFTGVVYVESSAEEIASLRGKVFEAHASFYENQFVVYRNGSQEEVFIHKGGKLYPLYHVLEKDFVFGLTAKNIRQKMAFELLLDPNISLVTISGKAGTGKTLLGLGAGLEQTLDPDGPYERVLAARPIVPMGRDIGYLPGEKEDKINPWMQPIYDNLEYLFNCKDNTQLKKTLSGDEDYIQVEALTYIRGRSIPNQFILIDEAQNLTKHEVKTIVTRVGEGSKIVLMGDPEQIDHPYLDAYSNGLTYLIEKMKDQKIAGHIELDKGERSELAQICADIL